jgi:Zn-dependent M28 family amino/carboxypeptidase
MESAPATVIHMNIRTASALVALLGSATCTPGPEGLNLPEGTETAGQLITPELLRDHVEYLASDRLEGRGPGTRGDRLAREYLAARLEELGYAPGGPAGSWEQPVPLVGSLATMPEGWVFQAHDGATVALRWWEDYIATSGGRQEDVTSIEEAEIVFVGYGIEAPEQDWDDFKGEDVRGKILLMLNNDPDWDPGLFGGTRRLYYGRWTYKYEQAARHGAAGAIILHTAPSAGYPWSVVQTSWSGEQFQLEEGTGEPLGIKAWAAENAVRGLVRAAGHDLEDLVAAARSRQFRPIPLGITTSITFRTRFTRTETANVVGLLAGSDPELAREVVVYSAHHDHLGIGVPNEAGDSIYNGALDNGVAMAQALAVARAVASLPSRPRRSILFLFVAAEEQGLLGSAYFARHPTFPPGRIAANINFEMGNVWGITRDVAIFGKGKSTLEDLLATAAGLQDRVVVGEADPEAGWYYRSDQLSFARIGVPAIWFKSGSDFIGKPPGWGDEVMSRWIAERYHQPSDEVEDTWVFEGMVEDALLALWLGLHVANSDEGPKWYPGDEFEEIRRAALDAVRQDG